MHSLKHTTNTKESDMTANELKATFIENGAESWEEVKAAIEDGAALATMGITDDDQDEVNELHHQATRAVAA